MSSFRLGRALLAASTLLIGVVLVLRPFGSVAALAATLGAAIFVIGVGEILRGRERSNTAATTAGCLMLAVGMVTGVWPALSIDAVGVCVGVGFAIYGCSRLVAAVREAESNRVADLLLGVSGLGLAVVAVAAPGLSLFSVCLVAGVALVWSGVAGLFYSVGRRAGVVRPQAPRLVGAVIAVVITVPLAAMTVQARAVVPTPDAFYEAAAEGAPGTLLRVSPFNGEVPDGAQAWRILYTTRGDADRPALGSGIVVAPGRAGTTPSPVVAWAHAATGIARGCAPSLLTAPFAAGRMPGLGRVLDRGWTVVAADYPGLGTEGPPAYLTGRAPARSILDAVRAAHSLDRVELADRTVVWGHSQGGHAALWADLIAADYAPDVPLAGVATSAPITDLRSVARNLGPSTGHDLFGAYLIDAYSQAYPDVHAADHLRLQSRLPMARLAGDCWTEPSVGVHLTRALAVGAEPYSAALDSGALGRRLAGNTPVGATDTPLLILQGGDDDLATAAVQDGYVEQRRALGASVDYRSYPARGHDSLVDDDSPAVADLIRWTGDRLS